MQLDSFTDLKRCPVAVVKCSAPWCKPCVTIQPLFEELARTLGVPAFTLDVSEPPSGMDTLLERVTVVPTFFECRDGEAVRILEGSDPTSLREFFGGFQTALAK